MTLKELSQMFRQTAKTYDEMARKNAEDGLNQNAQYCLGKAAGLEFAADKLNYLTEAKKK